MFRIIWSSKLTGAPGPGEFTMSESEANVLVVMLNISFPELRHYIEKQEVLEPLNLKGHRCSYGDISFVANASPSASNRSTPSLASPKPAGSTASEEASVKKPSSSVTAQVCQPLSSPPPSDFSTSFF